MSFGIISVQKLSVIALTLSCFGCSSTQVNENTLDIAGTYDQLIVRQVTANLIKTVVNPFGIPAFARVTVQSAQTTNSISPSFSFPLSSQVTRMTQSALGATGLTTGTTLSRSLQRAGEGFSLGLSDQWNQGYTITPVTDPDQLRRLRLLFQYVTRSMEGVDYSDPTALSAANDSFEASYPMIEAASSGGSSSSMVTVIIDGKSVSVKQGSTPSQRSNKQFVRRLFATDAQTGNVTGTTWTRISPDLTFVAQPGCIMCDYGHKLTSGDLKATTDKDILENAGALTKLEKNYDLSETWFARPNEPSPVNLIKLPAGILDSLYARDESKGLKYFFEFVLFCVEASSQGTGSPTSGGQSDGRKTSVPQTISIPVGGVVTTP